MKAFAEIQDEIIGHQWEGLDKGFITERERAVYDSMKVIFNETAEDATRALFDLVHKELDIIGWEGKAMVLFGMPEVKYGSKVIRLNLEEKEGLNTHYISVEKNAGVVLKGAPVSDSKAEQLILKRAKWILNKLTLVDTTEEEEIVTGSRILYFGRRYYTEVIFDADVVKDQVAFNHSQFKIMVNPSGDVQQAISNALFDFYRLIAKERIEPRIKKWSQSTGLVYREAKFMKLEKRWGSCTDTNTSYLM